MFVLKWKRQPDIRNGRNSEKECPEMTTGSGVSIPWGHAVTRQKNIK